MNNKFKVLDIVKNKDFLTDSGIIVEISPQGRYLVLWDNDCYSIIYNNPLVSDIFSDSDE